MRICLKIYYHTKLGTVYKVGRAHDYHVGITDSRKLWSTETRWHVVAWWS